MEIEFEQLTTEFRERFAARSPRFFRAPGRVNLIGEHTDYNDGFVMPFAIDRATVVAGAVREDTKINAFARDLDETGEFDLSDEPKKRRGNWMDYIEGAVRGVAEKSGKPLRGADLLITSTVPIGAGLSSSAALEISIGLAVSRLNEVEIDAKELAFAGQRTEHEYVGTRSGIMDQFTSVFGKKGRAMLLDCRSLAIDYIPIETSETIIAVIDTKVKHELASSEYNTRRSECEQGVEIIKKHSPDIAALRDVTIQMLEQHAGELPLNIARRCRHVVSENARTLSAADAFRSDDFSLAGKLMLESHLSLRDDYEVSSPELDLLVDSAMIVEGVYGARMTGGGFGGCTVNLLEKDAVDELRRVCNEAYSARFGVEPDFYLFQASEGASEVTV